MRSTSGHRNSGIPLRQPGYLSINGRDPWFCVPESLRVCLYRRGPDVFMVPAQFSSPLDGRLSRVDGPCE